MHLYISYDSHGKQPVVENLCIFCTVDIKIQYCIQHCSKVTKAKEGPDKIPVHNYACALDRPIGGLTECIMLVGATMS